MHNLLKSTINMMLDQGAELWMGALEALVEYYTTVDLKVLEDFTEIDDYVEYRYIDWASG